MSTTNYTDPAPTPEDIWRLFRETDRLIKELAQENDRRFQETDRKFQETDRKFQETDRKFQKTDREFQETKQLLQELARQSQETDRKFQETDRKFQETDRKFQETDRKFQETDRKFQKTDREFQETKQLLQELARQSQETDRKFQETDRKFQETDRKFLEIARNFAETDKKIGNLGNRLGEFVEGMVAPALIKLFQARGIDVRGLSHDISRSSPRLNLATQIDLFVVNGDSCIVIEVKSKLSIDDINEHIERMEKFKPLFPEYVDKQVYGAVAAMVIPEDVAKYAYRKGFFVLAQQGETVAILNDEKFKPMAW